MRLLAFVLAAALRCFYPSPRYAKARSLLHDIVQGWTPRFHAPPVKVDLAPVKVYGQCRLLIFPAHMAGGIHAHLRRNGNSPIPGRKLAVVTETIR
ncbi:hypothetical protein SAMN05444678_10366 [Sphingomonas sp. YR710]|nr:hypothetical protein SAMN05444678_10366 [Sphingomonas sp. YR710]